MPQVIYARVPDELKQATDDYAAGRGLTLTAAVIDLLASALAVDHDQPSIARLQAEVATARAEAAAAVAEAQGARAELAALQSLSQRSSLPVGSCPSCSAPISGFDLLATGQCSNCSAPLSSLLDPSGAGSSLNQKDYLLLIGALGALLAVAWLSNRD